MSSDNNEDTSDELFTPSGVQNDSEYFRSVAIEIARLAPLEDVIRILLIAGSHHLHEFANPYEIQRLADHVMVDTREFVTTVADKLNPPRTRLSTIVEQLTKGRL